MRAPVVSNTPVGVFGTTLALYWDITSPGESSTKDTGCGRGAGLRLGLVRYRAVAARTNTTANSNAPYLTPSTRVSGPILATWAPKLPAAYAAAVSRNVRPPDSVSRRAAQITPKPTATSHRAWYRNRGW